MMPLLSKCRPERKPQNETPKAVIIFTAMEIVVSDNELNVAISVIMKSRATDRQ